MYNHTTSLVLATTEYVARTGVHIHYVFEKQKWSSYYGEKHGGICGGTPIVAPTSFCGHQQCIHSLHQCIIVHNKDYHPQIKIWQSLNDSDYIIITTWTEKCPLIHAHGYTTRCKNSTFMSPRIHTMSKTPWLVSHILKPISLSCSDSPLLG